MGASYTSPKASFTGPTAFSYTPLLSDGDDVVSRSCSLAAGTMARGTIAKYAFDTGVVAAVAVVADANCVVADTIDATGGAAAGLVYISGKMKADALIWPALDHGLVTDQLRHCGILVETVTGTLGAMIRSAGITEFIDIVGTLTPASIQAPAAGGASSFVVKTNGSQLPWQGSTAAPWLHVTAPTAPAPGDGTVSYTVDAQAPGGPARTGTIIIAALGVAFTVNQDAG